ncbi:hypothetical protein BC332_29375 [Capsicum chinense]|nr:hypothetical protein BC332_29375 [Capsicum chinense]
MGRLSVMVVKGRFTTMSPLDGMNRLLDMVHIGGMGRLIAMGDLGDIDFLGSIDKMSIIGRQLGCQGLLGHYRTNEQYRLLDRLGHRGRHRPMCHLGAFDGMCLFGVVGDIGLLGVIGIMGLISCMGHLKVIGGLCAIGQMSVMGRCTAWEPSISMGHFAIMVDLCLFDVVNDVGFLGTECGMVACRLYDYHWLHGSLDLHGPHKRHGSLSHYEAIGWHGSFWSLGWHGCLDDMHKLNDMIQMLSSRFNSHSSGTLFYILYCSESSYSEDVMSDVGFTELFTFDN